MVTRSIGFNPSSASRNCSEQWSNFSPLRRSENYKFWKKCYSCLRESVSGIQNRNENQVSLVSTFIARERHLHSSKIQWSIYVLNWRFEKYI